ncbi:MAG TPA: SDR family oxidoreductase [Chthonomonadales bacterium]|nr:SDR family oxidoreductase [Chthonomonadales bacterium]
MFRLEGKACVVTGAGSGIGEQIATAYAHQGASVLVADIDSGAGVRVAKALGGAAIYRCTDVTDARDVASMVGEAVACFGRLDVLVNNAGIGLVGSVEETEPDDFARLMRVNVDGVYHGCRAAVPVMLAHGGGVIINLASVAGLIGVERRFAYCATKGAVVAMTRQIAIDYAARGIRVNAICPGTVHTPFVEGALQRFHAGEIEETRAKLHARQPCGRMGRADEIAAMAVYLASDEAAFVTGALLTIDGGWTAR